jgi:RiboL-PSP-HEPN
MSDQVSTTFSELEAYVKALNLKFINPHIPANPEAGVETWQLDVKAFCILSHAACEEFCEITSLYIMNASIEQWLTKRKTDETMLSLLTFYRAQLVHESDEAKSQERVFDLMRALVNETKEKHSKQIHNNHGVSLAYLRSILTPVGIDVHSDPRHLTALAMLASARGSFAHKKAQDLSVNISSTAPKIISPEDAKKMVDDVIDYLKEIRDRSVKRLKAIAV